MAVKYEIEDSIAALMVKRLGVENLRNIYAKKTAWELGLKNEWKIAASLYNEIGRKIRHNLRKIGFEKDCEIEYVMDELAVKAKKANDDLQFYIFQNSPICAKRCAAIGMNDFVEYQILNPSPIRPDWTR